jgi:hypothetical protein
MVIERQVQVGLLYQDIKSLAQKREFACKICKWSPFSMFKALFCAHSDKEASGIDRPFQGFD